MARKKPPSMENPSPILGEPTFRLIFEDHAAAMLLIDPQTGNILDANQAAVNFYGYPKSKLCGMSIQEINTLTPEQLAAERQKALTEERNYFIFQHRLSGGEERIVEVYSSPIIIQKKRVLFSIIHDVTERTNEELRKSEERYRTLFDNMTDGIYRSTHAGRFLDINPAMVKMFGYSTREEMLAVDIKNELYFSPEERGSHILDTGREEIEAYRMRRKNGSEIWVEDHGHYVHDEQGNILYHEGMLRDITERKRAAESLQDSHNRLLTILDSLDADIYVADLNTYEILFMNRHMRESFGENLVGQVCWQAFRGSSLRCPHCTNRGLVDADGNPTGVCIWEGQNPLTQRWYTNYDRAIRWLDGRLVRLQIAIDITEHKRTEQSLRERERQYRTLVEQIPAVVYIDDVSKGFHTLYVSPQIESMLGFTPEEWLQKSPEIWYSLIEENDREQVNAKYLDCIKTGEPFEAEYQMKTADGRPIWIHDQAVMLRDENGKPQLINGVMQDITAHKQAEEEIRRRVTELEMLYESGLAINQLLDPVAIGQKVIELLKDKLDWHHTAIRLYHPQDESLELLAFNQPGLINGMEWRKVENRFKTLVSHSGQGVSGWAVRHKQVVRSNNLPNDPRYVDTYPGLQSGLYVPMLIGDRVMGVISIESEKPNAFSAADERLTTTLANQAASALENARLFKQTERRFQEFAALYETSNILSGESDLNSMLQVTVEHARKLLGAASSGIYLYLKESDEIALTVAMTPYSITGTHLESGEGVAGHVVKTRQPLRVGDYSTWENRSPKYNGSLFHAVLGVPMLYGGELIGVLMVGETGDSTRRFTEADERLLSLFASQAAGAIHSARLFEQTERRFREFAALYETSNALSAETDLSDLLQVIVENARRLLDATTSGMYFYVSESGELELVVDTASYLPTGTRLQLGEGAAGRVAQTRQPLRLDDYSTWEGRSHKYGGIPIRAVIEVPMLYGGELIGVLTADEIGGSERKFTEADERLLSLFASQAAGAIRSARLREETARRLNQLQALHTIDRAISSSFELRPILNTVIIQAINQLNVDAVDVLLYHPHLQRLEYLAGQGFRTRGIEQSQLHLGEGFSGRAALERRTIHASNLTEADPDFTRAAMLKAEGFLEFYALPLIAKGEVKGVLEVFHRTALPSNPEWMDFLETIAKQAAITIDQTQLFDNLQRANIELVIAYDATIEGWARAMDLRDKETESHTERVTELTVSLAGAMGVKDGEILNMRRGALLHDIGKIGVPDNILLKEGKLTEEEWTFMRRHPQFAYEMLQPIKYLRQALDIPYCHHEKWDGTGYPRGLKGEQIPLAARIFAIADVWDAVTSDRPYRKAWTSEEALSYIREQSGKQFDPKVVKVFLSMIES